MKKSTVILLTSTVPLILLVLFTVSYGMYTYISHDMYIKDFYRDIKYDRLDAVKAKIDNDPELLNTRTSLHTTPLQEAVWHGSNQTVRHLLSIGCNRDETWRINGPHDGYTLLHIVAIQGHQETCEFLIRQGCKPDQPSKDGTKPIDIARHNGHKHLVELLK